ncbi:mechanosensitive ion channel [Candidatus Woesearchaeota archaeon]|nr:mechanosensitive ion channel [Candidatus Woesearchaeota archaeon]
MMGVEDVFVYLRGVLSSVYTNALSAIIILLIGFVVARLAGRLVQKLMQEFEINKLFRKAANLKISLEEVVAGLVTYLIYFVVIIISLHQLGVAPAVLNFILIAMLVIVLASILLGFRDFLPNLIAGIYIYRERFLHEGDMVKVGGVEGEIVKLSATELRLKTNSDEIIYIPNSLLTKKEVVKLKN